MISFSKPLGGMAIWATFNDPYKLSEISRKLSAHGICLNDGSLYVASGLPSNFMRIEFASMNEKEMISFVKELKSLKNR